MPPARSPIRFSVQAGDTTEFLFEFTRLVEDSQNPGTVRRAYLTVNGLDLLSVAPGPTADIPYTTPKYVADVGEEPGQWHSGRYTAVSIATSAQLGRFLPRVRRIPIDDAVPAGSGCRCHTGGLYHHGEAGGWTAFGPLILERLDCRKGVHANGHTGASSRGDVCT